MSDKPAKLPTPPYVSYRTFINVLQDLAKNGIPPQIDRSTFPGMSGGTYNQLTPALRYLQLTDSTDHSLDNLKLLVRATGEERQKTMSTIVRNAYPYLFSGFDLMAATPKLLEDRFRVNGAAGDTIRKCVTFFVNAARDAGIPLGSRIANMSRGTAERNGISRPRPAARRAARTPKLPDDNKRDEQPIKQQELDSLPMATVIKAAMDKIPTFDPNWPKETQDNYLKYVERVFNLADRAMGEKPKKDESE